jgi:AraC-like DNA-binding protein
MRYATRWKMHTAEVWLRQGNASIAELSRLFGYESEAAFSRAFKRFIGVPPGSARRNGTESLPAGGTPWRNICGPTGSP